MTTLKRYFQRARTAVLTLLLFSSTVFSGAYAQEESSDGNFLTNAFDSFREFWSEADLENESDTYMVLPERTWPSQRVIETLGGGDYLGRHRVTGEDCLISSDKDALDQFSTFAPCWMNNLYRERFDEEIAGNYPGDVVSYYNGRLPQAHSLQLKKEGVQEFCQCTMAKQNLAGLMPTENRNGEVVERKQQVMNTLARDGMSRIQKKLEAIQKRVAYSVTSREMAGYIRQESRNPGDSEGLQARTSLTYCMPSEMTKLLRYGNFESGEEGERLCGERGIKRLAEGMSKGTRLRCQTDVPFQTPLGCGAGTSPMDRMELNNDSDPLAEITRGLHGFNVRDGSPSIEDLSEVLNRHQEMVDVPYREAVRIRGAQYRMNEKAGSDLDFSRIGGALFGGESLSNGDYSSSMIGMVNRSRQNEFSENGKKLWDRNMASIKRAFESAVSSSGTVSWDALQRVDVDHLKEYIKTNPYLEQRLLVSIESDETSDLSDPTKLRAAVKSYVERDLYPAYQTEGSPSEYDLASLMGISYGPEFYKALNECEEIQKAMISLCRAFDQEEGEENIGHFFTDPQLVDLFADSLNSMQKGQGSPGAFKEFGAASHFFCEEAQSEGRVDQLNQRQARLDYEYSDNSIFAQMEQERELLHDLASKDRQTREMASKEYEENKERAVSNPDISLSDATETIEYANNARNRNSGSKTHNETQKVVRPRARPTQETSLDTQMATVDQGDFEAVDEQGDPENEQNNGEKLQSADMRNSGQADANQYNRFQDSFNYDQSLNSELDEGENALAKSTEERSLEEQRLAEEELARAQLENVSPVEKELMDQLESMREREAQMMRQLEGLSDKMEEDRKNEELEKKEQEVASLKEQMQELQQELSEVKRNQNSERQATPARARVERSENNPSLFGNSRPEKKLNPRDRAATAVSRVPDTATPAPSSFPSGAKPPVSRDSSNSSSSSASLGSDSSLSSGLVGPTLTGSTSQSAARIRVPRGARIAPPDTSLTSLALNAEGNVALRETTSPGVLERVVFKTENGEIVYENGHPVIDKRETLNVDESEESEALAELEEVPDDDEASRAPASIEEELLEIERELRPRASHQELIETLQQNTGN